MADRYPHIKEFQSDYERSGAFELERQAPHLARLADHYAKRYSKTEDWTDCLKVHSVHCNLSMPCYMLRVHFCVSMKGLKIVSFEFQANTMYSYFACAVHGLIPHEQVGTTASI